MARQTVTPVVLVVCAILTSVAVVSAAPVTIYGASTAASQLSGWGGGKAEVSKSTKYDKDPALEIDTKGYHEGGFVKLAAPVDLASYMANTNGSQVVVMVKITAAQGGQGEGRRGRRGRGRRGGGIPGASLPGQSTSASLAAAPANESNYQFYAQMPGMPGGTPPGMPGGMPGMPGGPAGGQGMPGMGMPGGEGMPGMGGPGMGMPGMGGPGMGGPGMGMPGMGGPGMGMPGMGGPGMGGPGMGGPGMGGGRGGRGDRGGFRMRTLRAAKPLEAVRVVLVTDKGQMDGGSYVVSKLEKQGEWAQVKIPLSKFKGPGAKSGAKLLGAVFTGDSNGKVIVGHAELQGA